MIKVYQKKIKAPFGIENSWSKRLKNKFLDHLNYFNDYKSANDQAVIN